MGSNKSGFENENKLITYLNNKKVKELNQNLKQFIYFLFDNINEESKIKTLEGKKGQKPDITIIINNDIKRISIKKGSGNSVHQEKIEVFTKFLSSINIPNDIINELLMFHWGDGTCDGTGEKRILGKKYEQTYPDKIDKINLEFNKEANKKKFINRFIIQGKSEEYDLIDALYHGNVEEGHWASKDEIINYFVDNEFKSNSIHFGSLTYQVWNRCLNLNPKMEERRYVMQVKWGSLLKDLIIIERNRKVGK